MSHINPVYESLRLPEGQFLFAPSLFPERSTSPSGSKEQLIYPSVNQLPPKNFSHAQQPKWKRALWQTFIGIAQLLTWIAVATVCFFFIYDSSQPTCVDDTYSFFSPDSVYGNFTLGEVRMIDISFNLVAGRGLQTALGLVAYRVITDSLMRMMELTPVSFELFSALTFQLSSVLTIWSILKAFFKLPGWRPKFIMGWTLFSAVFLTALPTLMDTMSGYVQNQDYSVTFKNGTTIPVPDISGFYGNQTTTDNLKKQNGGEDPLLRCFPNQSGGYQWGFASLWVLLNWAVLGLWMLGTYSMWMDAQHNCELRRKGRTMNSYRAVTDMAEAIREVLGPNTAPYSGQELEKALKRCDSKVMYVADVDELTGLGKVGLSSRKKGKMEKLSWDVVYGEERE